MNTTGNKPIGDDEAARAGFFKDRIDAIKKAYEEGVKAHAEFMAKEHELHVRTEALITAFPSDNTDESAIIPIYSYVHSSLYDESVVIPAVRIIQKKIAGTKGGETSYSKATIELLIIEEGKLPKHLEYVNGFDNKVYGHNARPGVGTRESIESVNGYIIQENYESRLTELEKLLLEKTD
jgi:hypothetical protein